MLCPRKGVYRLARLAARYGPEQNLDHLLADLASSCPWWRSTPRKYDPRCGARFVDLERNLPPRDDPDAPVHRERQPAREDVPRRRSVAASVAGHVPMLSGWPLPTITIVCDRCGRRDEFRKDQLLLSTPGDVRLTDLRVSLTLGCTRRGSQSIYEQCGARFKMPDASADPSGR